MLTKLSKDDSKSGLLPTPPLPDDMMPASLTDNARQVLVRRYLCPRQG